MPSSVDEANPSSFPRAGYAMLPVRRSYLLCHAAEGADELLSRWCEQGLSGARKGAEPQDRTSRLLGLPMEILAKIAAATMAPVPVQATDASRVPSTTVLLAITHPTLFWAALPVFKAYRADRCRRWLKCRIVCIGDYADFDDLPPNLLTSEERREIEDGGGQADAYGGTELLNCTQPSICNRSLEPHILDANICWKFMMFSPEYKNYKDLLNVLWGEPSYILLKRHDWVVCNWSKRAYVRARAVADLCKEPDDEQPFLPNCPITLAHVVLSRICWSSDPFISMPYNGDIHRGEWAGDRFTITTLVQVSQEESGFEETWKDVSAEVVEELRRIWTADCGDSDPAKWPL